ncbi:hypothetical protein FKM82_008568 [Ascaphus truei]
MDVSGLSRISVTISLPTSTSVDSPPATDYVKHRQLDTTHKIERGVAAARIQWVWRCHRNRKLFKLLKHTARAAETCATYGILRKVSPLEAELLRDPGMQCKVRFRFAGHEFPPFIVFKIFHRSGGYGNRYISGKRIINPSSEAAADACKLMGQRAYYDQMICDEQEYQKRKITDVMDVATLKDYMQYISHLDETPAHLGGRDNCWRRLSLKNLPRTTIMYDIVDYAESGTLSERLKKEMELLLQMPHTEEDVQQRQLSAVTQISTWLIQQLTPAGRTQTEKMWRSRRSDQMMTGTKKQRNCMPGAKGSHWKRPEYQPPYLTNHLLLLYFTVCGLLAKCGRNMF